MSEPSDDLLKALADLMYQGQDSPAAADASAETPDVPAAPPTEDFLARLAACERTVNS
jgi:hypothetical protein